LTKKSGSWPVVIDSHMESEYVLTARYPEREEVYRQMADASSLARSRYALQVDLAYGPHPLEKLDLFVGTSGSPLLVFFHGGYWRSQDKSSFSFVAPAFLDHGISVAVVGYPLAPVTPIKDIVNSARAAAAWLAGEGRARLPPGCTEMVLAGHSAGGHLAAMVAIRPPEPPPDIPNRLAVVGCVTLSGLFDLQPIAQTSIGIQVGLNEATAASASPLRLPVGPGWLLAAVGDAETFAFREQTAKYAHHWRDGGGTAHALTLAGLNHYTIPLELGRSDSALMQDILKRIKTSSGHAS
jgi:arylformamidase